MTLKEIIESIGTEDYRGILAILLLALIIGLVYLDEVNFAMTVFAGFMAVVAQYFYAKGEP